MVKHLCGVSREDNTFRRMDDELLQDTREASIEKGVREAWAEQIRSLCRFAKI